MIHEQVVRALAGMNYKPFRTEADLHEQVLARIVDLGCVDTTTQYELDASNVVDVMCPFHGLAIELKIGGSASCVLRQLERYARFSCVREIILVTSCARHMALCSVESLYGKRLHVVRVGSL